MLHLHIEAALGQAWKGDEAGATAEQALRALFGELANLIGNHAVRALYLRAVHVSGLSLTRPGQASEPLDTLLADLRQNLASRQPAEARTVAQALLESLVALLVSLIGQPLTLRLVTSAWAASPPLQPRPEKT